MEFFQTSKIYSLRKSTYLNLRWTAYFGQLLAILLVKFLYEFEFNYIACILIIIISILSNFYLEFKIQESQLDNYKSTIFLIFDIFQLFALFFLTGGITNPFIFIIIIPAVFSSQYLNLKSSLILVLITSLLVIILTFYFYNLPGPSGEPHFHVPDYYLYSIPISIIIGLVYLVYFGAMFGKESRIRKEAYDKIQEIMSKENELLSLGAQAAAAAHSLGTPLSTILLTANELKKDFGNDEKIIKDLDLLISQSTRCREILKKLTLNPTVEDDFIDKDLSLYDYVKEIVNSFEEISSKNFNIDTEQNSNSFDIRKSIEIVYGIRNFIGNANKFAKKNIYISIISDSEVSNITIEDDGSGFSKDILNKIGEPYIKSLRSKDNIKSGLGLGIFIGKTLLEKNQAKLLFRNSETRGGAEIKIEWLNKNLINI